MSIHIQQLYDIVESGREKLSTLTPSEWAEARRMMSTDVTPFPGKFNYDRTPYLREVVDNLSPNSSAQMIAVMKGAQIGFSTGVIESGVGWIIEESPGNILFLSGHAELSEEAMNKKIDQMIDSAGLRHLIRPNTMRKKNQRTGDTAKSKEFPGGSLTAGSASNHKLLAQRSVQYGFIDDYDDVKASSKTDGSTTKLIEQRFAAYSSKMKLMYISTPRLMMGSNIHPLFLKGDQRRYFIPCTCCGERIPLLWTVPIEGTDGKEKGGITYKLDNHGHLVTGSVGYICQMCGGFFDDSRKFEQNLAGEWRKTAVESQPGFYSYHISSLYAPPGMFDWEKYARDYVEANPQNAPRDEKNYQTFVNLGLGEPYEPQGESPKANDLQKKTRAYDVGKIPETLSIKDGNGRIVLVTAAADMNGTEQDARMDYEVVAWSESGATYSIKHGSIGTFIPREGAKKNKQDRQHWTYEHNRPNSVWPELKKILSTPLDVDTGRKMPIMISGLDCGYLDNFVYGFIDKANGLVVGLKGKDEAKSITFGADKSTFRPARERKNLYLVEVNSLKDDLADFIKLKWDAGNDPEQPPNFMNFPEPSGGMYQFNNFYSHFEAEHKVIERKENQPVAFRWVKKSSLSQNHQMDCRIYNMVVKDIFLFMFAQASKIPNPAKFSWADFVALVPKKSAA